MSSTRTILTQIDDGPIKVVELQSCVNTSTHKFFLSTDGFAPGWHILRVGFNSVGNIARWKDFRSFLLTVPTSTVNSGSALKSKTFQNRLTFEAISPDGTINRFSKDGWSAHLFLNSSILEIPSFPYINSEGIEIDRFLSMTDSKDYIIVNFTIRSLRSIEKLIGFGISFDIEANPEEGKQIRILPNEKFFRLSRLGF
jgi:hypothetical protein